MPAIKRISIVGGVLIMAAVAATGHDFRDSFTAVTPTNFDAGGEVSRQFHLNAESYLTMSTVHAPAQPRPLLAKLSASLAGTPVVHRNGQSTFAEYVAQDDLIDGVVIIKNGYIVFEAYPNMRPEQRHFAWSVTKVVTATALAVLVEQEKVEMTTPIDQYLPELADSSWAGVSVQNVADMASGINCLDSDGYQDPSTCIYTHEEALGITAPTGRDPKFIPHLQSMPRVTEPGTRYEYVSANTNVLALLIETITKKQFSDALAELVWRPIGAESDSLTAISKAGFAYGSGGLHARLRDIARFGQVFVQPDLADVLSPSTVRKIQLGGQSFTDHQIEDHQTTFGDDVPERAGWQWDMIWSDEAMYKSGYLGQGLYVDPSRDLVIAWFGTGLDYSEIENEMLPISRQIAHSMDKGKVP